MHWDYFSPCVGGQIFSKEQLQIESQVVVLSWKFQKHIFIAKQLDYWLNAHYVPGTHHLEAD